MPLQCSKCTKLFDYTEELKGYTYENDDAHMWYCEKCHNEEPREVRRIYQSCQWCKQEIKGSPIIPYQIIVMHLDCYEKLLEVRQEKLADLLC